MPLRVISILLSLVAVILFVVAALVNAVTGNPLHYIEWGLALFAGAFGTYVLSTIVERVP